MVGWLMTRANGIYVKTLYWGMIYFKRKSHRNLDIDTSMTCCPLITLTLKIISVRCIPLNLRSKTRRRATLLLTTWIYSCQSVGTVNFTLPFTTSVTILISILHTFRSWAAHPIFARLWRFYLTTHPIRQG